MAKAAVLLPRQEMQQMAADLIAQYPNLSPFCIEYTHTDAACQRAIRLQNDGCELILARGLQAALVDELAHQMPNIVGMKDTSGDITLTAEFIRRTRDVGFKVFGGKDTLLYASLCHGAVGGVCTAANFMPELITDVYNKFAAGDLQGSLEAQFKLNPVRLAMDPASFPVAAKDMAALRGRDVGAPYRPSLPTPEGPAKEGFRRTMSEAGLI